MSNQDLSHHSPKASKRLFGNELLPGHVFFSTGDLTVSGCIVVFAQKIPEGLYGTGRSAFVVSKWFLSFSLTSPPDKNMSLMSDECIHGERNGLPDACSNHQ